jgi:hypothetical protein
MNCTIFRTPVVAAALAALIAAGGCAGVPAASDRYVAPSPGASWEHQRSDSGSYGSATHRVRTQRVDATWQGQQAIGLRSPEGTLLLRANGEWLAQLDREGAVAVTWDPPLLWDWPIHVGKSWAKAYSMTLHPSGRTISYQVRQTVEGFEDVTVPAGTFKAFRIASTDTLGNEDKFWFQPELGIFVKLNLRRTEKHPQGPGQREVQLVSHTRPGGL